MLIPKKEPCLVLMQLHPPECRPDSEAYDPFEVFDQLFGYYHLVDVHRYLYEMFRMAASRPDLDVCSDREDAYFSTYEMLHDVVTAAYVLTRSRHNKKGKLLTN